MNSNNKKLNTKLYLVTKNAIPNVLIDVLKTKDLIEKESLSVSQAVSKIGISRTTYYKYCNEVFYYDKEPESKTIDLEIITQDKVGMLSTVTNAISKNNFSILTINQFPPVKKQNRINITMVTTNSKCDLNALIETLKNNKNVKEVKIKSFDEGTE